MKIHYVFVAVIVLLACGLLSFPVRDLKADYYYREVSELLDDKTTEALDVMPISDKSMPSYLAAVGALQKAAAIVPSRSIYQGALADIYTHLGDWAQIMLSLKAPIPSDAISPQDASDKTLRYLHQAIACEPTRPDFHLALGRFYDHHDEPELAVKELKLAEYACPANAALRYALALHYLVSGRKGDALEQARVLAKIDDSYIIPDSVEKEYMLERQTPAYITMIKGSYLYGVFEIAWRVSHDIEVIRGITPDTPDAAPVLQLFLSSK